MFGLFKNRRRRAICRQAFSPFAIEAIHQNVAFYRNASREIQTKLDDTIKILCAELAWEGCNGLAVTEQIKVTISGHAAVMLLGTPDYYFHTISTLLIYPNSVQRLRNGGHETNAGEAYQTGQIMLSWPHVERDSRELDGRNVVIHEFAHHLDSLDGEMGGTLPFADRHKSQSWQEVSEREYKTLQEAARIGRPTLLDHYGAKSPAEFFATSSECLFELPNEMRQRHPDLFALLCDFYHLNPSHLQ